MDYNLCLCIAIFLLINCYSGLNEGNVTFFFKLIRPTLSFKR
jgi:hypothetical protein